MSTFIVETSARHVHVTKEALEILFGAGATLTKKKDLAQPGQFACEEKVTVIGPKGQLKASILGPERKDCQVELSATDARSIGVSAPVRISGDLEGAGACKIIGPKGEIDVKEGVIAARRHIHATPEDAEREGLTNNQIVSVEIPTSNKRNLVFGDVVVRVSDTSAWAMHIDTDESNAAGMAPNTIGKIIK